MSHLDELDEFEAELELTLKKEYSAVFGLFRYCVLTQDATYLCNKLDLQYVPQQSYPFFQLKMEDVWVGRFLSQTQTSSILRWKNG